jgi:hypothetical protein
VADPVSPSARDDLIDQALHQLARAIVKHPLAAQAAYRALVREGRAFAQTDEGRRVRAHLARSELAARLRTAWQLVTFGMLEGDAPPGAIPSVLIEALVQAVLRSRFEARLSDALLGRSDGGEPSAT